MGYVKDTGIVKDERGVVISGHRRLAALEKLGMEPPPDTVKVIRFGDGDTADVERLKVAIGLNTAQKPFTASDRKRIAEYLYGTGEWSMVRIGDCSRSAIQRYMTTLLMSQKCVQALGVIAQETIASCWTG